MTARVPRQDALPPPDAPVKLDAMACNACGQLGATIVMVGSYGNGAASIAWCSPTCAKSQGWPEISANSLPPLNQQESSMARKNGNGAKPAAESEIEVQPIEVVDAGDLVDIVDFAAETLTGDVRDFILDRLKHEQSKAPWHQRSEADQRDTVHQVEAHVQSMVRRAVELIAAGGRRSIRATLEQVTIKDGIKATVSLSKFDEQRHSLVDAQGASILIVVADPEEFQGERAPAEITPDQGKLPVDAAVVHSAADGVDVPFH